MTDKKKAYFARVLEENPALLKGRPNIYKESLVEEGKENLIKLKMARVDTNNFGRGSIGSTSSESMGVLAQISNSSDSESEKGPIHFSRSPKKDRNSVLIKDL